MLIKHNHRHPKINRFDICISNLALGLTHSLAFKRYTQIYALLFTVMFMMTSMYMFQVLNNMYDKLANDDGFLVKILVKISKITVF